MRQYIKQTFIIAIIFTLITIIMVPFHEGMHWVISDLEGLKPTSIHIFDSAAFHDGAFGFITTQKSGFFPLHQEIILYGIQILITSFAIAFVLKKKKNGDK